MSPPYVQNLAGLTGAARGRYRVLPDIRLCLLQVAAVCSASWTTREPSWARAAARPARSSSKRPGPAGRRFCRRTRCSSTTGPSWRPQKFRCTCSPGGWFGRSARAPLALYNRIISCYAPRRSSSVIERKTRMPRGKSSLGRAIKIDERTGRSIVVSMT